MIVCITRGNVGFALKFRMPRTISIPTPHSIYRSTSNRFQTNGSNSIKQVHVMLPCIIDVRYRTKIVVSHTTKLNLILSAIASELGHPANSFGALSPPTVMQFCIHASKPNPESRELCQKQTFGQGYAKSSTEPYAYVELCSAIAQLPNDPIHR